MAVDSATSATSTQTPDPTAAAASTAKPTLDYDSFLKLLTAQMKFQDPTKPMDSTEFVAQLASFSNVEQGIKMNTKLDSLITSSALNQADSLIGKTVTSIDGKVTGVVKSVEIYSDGSLAVFEDGTKLLLDAGVKVSETPPASA
jgi:flagellar basal-body rod modification protein FlgD